MEGNMRGPSIQDCEKSFARTGIPSFNLLAKNTGVPGLVQIQGLHTYCKQARFESSYQRSLRANWTWRAVVEVLVMAPAVGETPEGVKTTALGKLKFARLSRLKISARN